MEEQGWFEGDLVERNQSKNYDAGLESFSGRAMKGMEVTELKSFGRRG